MKPKHNKKRNTAFLFEALIREMTKAMVRGNTKRKMKVLKIVKEHFAKGKPLYKELQLYKSIYETKNVDHLTAAKIVVECRNDHRQLDKKQVFKHQSFLISEVNKTVSPRVYNNFVPNYRALASIAQLFSGDTPAKSRVLLENKLIKQMTSPQKPLPEKRGLDEFTFKQYVKTFNKEYSTLLSEQKMVLGLFINDQTSLVSFLNEEIGRLRDALQHGLNTPEITADGVMTENTKRIIKILNDVKDKKLSEQTIVDILKIQKLVSEIQSNDD